MGVIFDILVVEGKTERHLVMKAKGFFDTGKFHGSSERSKRTSIRSWLYLILELRSLSKDDFFNRLGLDQESFIEEYGGKENSEEENLKKFEKDFEVFKKEVEIFLIEQVILKDPYGNYFPDIQILGHPKGYRSKIELVLELLDFYRLCFGEVISGEALSSKLQDGMLLLFRQKGFDSETTYLTRVVDLSRDMIKKDLSYPTLFYLQEVLNYWKQSAEASNLQNLHEIRAKYEEIVNQITEYKKEKRVVKSPNFEPYTVYEASEFMSREQSTINMDLARDLLANRRISQEFFDDLKYQHEAGGEHYTRKDWNQIGAIKAEAKRLNKDYKEFILYPSMEKSTAFQDTSQAQREEFATPKRTDKFVDIFNVEEKGSIFILNNDLKGDTVIPEDYLVFQEIMANLMVLARGYVGHGTHEDFTDAFLEKIKEGGDFEYMKKYLLATEYSFHVFHENRLISGRIDFLFFIGETLFVLDFKPEFSDTFKRGEDNFEGKTTSLLFCMPQMGIYLKLLMEVYGLGVSDVIAVPFFKDEYYAFNEKVLEEFQNFLEKQGLSSNVFWRRFF